MQKSCNYRVRRLFNDRPNPTFQLKPWHICINWGNSTCPPVMADSENRTINKFQWVSRASNKLSTFELLKDKDGIRIPTFTTDRRVASGWIADGGHVVCRTRLNGHSGAGIVLATTVDELVDAPLYVQYIKKQKEFRVHVAFGEVIDVQEKRKRHDLPEDFVANYQVRNHHTGWVYCREGIQAPAGLDAMALATVHTLQLDFGAVDIIWNEKRNELFVLEVNTAPGLEGTTVAKYSEAFIKALHNHDQAV